MTSQLTAYSPEYLEKCFVAWYSAGCPSSPKDILKVFTPDDNGRIPSIAIIRKWQKDYGWQERADGLDQRAITIVENDLIVQKADMLRRQAQAGFTLQQIGMAYLISGSFDSSSAAVTAVIRGAELERSSRGIGELLVKMASMTDSELEAEIVKQLNRASASGQIIEGEEVGNTEELLARDTD